MNHLKKFKKLNRTHSHRKALYRNMVEALLKRERITTTLVKAKEIRRIIEKIITRAKEKTLHNIRVVNKLIKDKIALKRLFDDIGPRFVTRNGGYTRIYKLGKRKGDGADLAILELLEELDVSKSDKKKKKRDKDKDETKKVDNKKKSDSKKIDKDSFFVYCENDVYSFNLMDTSNELRFQGESYKSKEEALKGVDLVKSIIDKADIVDLEADEIKKVTGPKFEVYKNAKDKFVFRLKSESGEIIGSSNNEHKTKENCLKDIESLRKIVKDADILS